MILLALYVIATIVLLIVATEILGGFFMLITTVCDDIHKANKDK